VILEMVFGQIRVMRCEGLRVHVPLSLYIDCNQLMASCEAACTEILQLIGVAGIIYQSHRV